jgi:hypothetical protein
MKHLSKFVAKRVAEYIRSQYERIEYADMIANQIENMAHPDGMIFHFAVSDVVGSNRMREIESECVMYVELERA